jgi:hypothetical protein
MGVCVACTEEDVVRRPEGEITIVPLWTKYNSADGFPGGIKYYFYNINDHSNFPVIVEESTGRGVITQVLPVGTYQLVGYNTDASDNLSFDDTKHITVVAKISPYPYSDAPLNLYIISSDNISIHDKDVKTQEIIPLKVNTKSLELVFRPGDDVTINTISGRLDETFASINLINGKAFEDESDVDIFFVADPDKKVKFRISDIYSLSYKNKKSLLSLTVEADEDGEIVKKTGEVDLSETIEHIRQLKIPNDNITLFVDINHYKNFKEKIKLTVSRQ